VQQLKHVKLVQVLTFEEKQERCRAKITFNKKVKK
jgi:hypothetical protein